MQALLQVTLLTYFPASTWAGWFWYAASASSVSKEEINAISLLLEASSFLTTRISRAPGTSSLMGSSRTFILSPASALSASESPSTKFHKTICLTIPLSLRCFTNDPNHVFRTLMSSLRCLPSVV